MDLATSRSQGTGATLGHSPGEHWSCGRAHSFTEAASEPSPQRPGELTGTLQRQEPGSGRGTGPHAAVAPTQVEASGLRSLRDKLGRTALHPGPAQGPWMCCLVPSPPAPSTQAAPSASQTCTWTCRESAESEASGPAWGHPEWRLVQRTCYPSGLGGAEYPRTPCSSLCSSRCGRPPRQVSPASEGLNVRQRPITESSQLVRRA